MNYWVTTHWPNSTLYDKDAPHFNVYIPNERESAVEDMEEGDIVYIYESRNGRTEKRTLVDGTIEYFPCHVGKEGIVNISRVINPVYENEGSEPTEYTDGSTIWWRYIAETENISSHGFINRELLNTVLGYKPNFNLRGFGDAHSGVKKISREQAFELNRLYNINSDSEIQCLFQSENSVHLNYGGIGGSGEGELHKFIKEKIAENPSDVLNEEGLELIKMEYEFKTNDRVDVLLIDRFGRYVVVEVEPECVNGNDIGSFQCMKYRSLMAFQTNRKNDEIRAILAAPIVSQEIIEKAKKYKIEVKIVRVQADSLRSQLKSIL